VRLKRQSANLRNAHRVRSNLEIRFTGRRLSRFYFRSIFFAVFGQSTAHACHSIGSHASKSHEADRFNSMVAYPVNPPERQNLTMRMQMPLYPAHQCVLKEIREPHAYGRALYGLVQLREVAQEP
jgi:hypothetical protein